MLANRNLMILAVAALLGIVAVILANSFLTGIEQREGKAAEQGRLVQIAVARVPIVYGSSLTAENIRMVSWPSNSIPVGAFQSTKGLVNGVQARVALRPIEAGEPILPGKITGPGGRASLSNVLETDMRAVTVAVSAVSGVAGFVLPGDVVDILLTRTPKVESDGSVDMITDVLMQSVRVLAIDQVANENQNKPKLSKTMTFSVDQQGAQKLTLAAKTGELTLALRNAANQDQFVAQTVGTRDLGQGDYSASYYPARRTTREPSFAANPFPYPVISGSVPRQKSVAVKPRPENAISVEIVRGTKSSNYDVTRHRGY
jgi:pilus assembly protein CpaB